MSVEPTRCPKCNGERVQGFLVNFHAGGKRLVVNWVEGAPEKSFWHSTNVPKDKCVPVGVFRCLECGFPRVLRAAGLRSEVGPASFSAPRPRARLPARSG